MDMIRSHGVRYLVIHGEWLYGARYEQLVSELDRRTDLTARLAAPVAARGQARRDQRLPRVGQHGRDEPLAFAISM